ncbi:hypothetical protein BD410DRAFT_509330 [Rickenella mellea]|uniref:F-box domain-containing protein n=1 Tax=Rickenella mellea TaxID=50990 RepID=A0A4Y7PSS9_9AGAM|nr:hypothetical protein BD410DRAFT_509330 [Rickenella mellea]
MTVAGLPPRITSPGVLELTHKPFEQVHVERREEQPGEVVCGELEDSERAGIRTLPAETLSAIFSNLLNDSYESNRLKYQYHSTFNPHRDLIVASHICHQWRHVALNTSSLWKHVSIAYNHYSHVEAFLLRSKISRLSVHVSIVNSLGNWFNPHPQLMVALNFVTANWHRITSLSLYLQEDVNDYAWIAKNWLRRFNPGREGSSNLRKLRIHGYVEEFDAEEIFFSSPKLPQLVIAKGLTELSLNKVRLDYSLIPHGLYDLIRSSPNVEILRLCVSYDDDDDEPEFEHPERISLLHLRQLFLTFRPHSVINHLLIDMDFSPDTNCEFTYDSMSTVGALHSLPLDISSSLRAFEMSVSMDKFRLRTTRSVGDVTPSKVNITVVPDLPYYEFSKRDMIVLLQSHASMPWIHPANLGIDLSKFGGSTPNAQEWLQLATHLPVLESLEIRITKSPWHEEEQQALLVLLEAFAIECEEPLCPRFRQLVIPVTAGDQLSERLSGVLTRCNQQREKLDLPSIAIAWEENLTKKADDLYGYNEF